MQCGNTSIQYDIIKHDCYITYSCGAYGNRTWTGEDGTVVLGWVMSVMSSQLRQIRWVDCWISEAYEVDSQHPRFTIIHRCFFWSKKRIIKSKSRDVAINHPKSENDAMVR